MAFSVRFVNNPVNVHRFACLTAGATFLLLIAGGLVTSTGSGLAVPDWPLSYGGLFPPMVGGIFYEHGHRMVAATVAILMTVLAAWLQIAEPRSWVRKLGWAALSTVLAQAVLGGITVLLMLPTVVSVAHACLAQTFFCMTVTLALVTSRGWNQVSSDASASEAAAGPTFDPKLARIGILTTGVVFLQLLVGAVMRHMDAGLAIPDFPLSFGGLIPPLESPRVIVNFTHRAGAIVVAACALWVLSRAAGVRRSQPALARLAMTLVALVCLQIALGAAIVWSGRAVFPATAHVASGAGVLAISLALVLQSLRGRTSSRARGAAVSTGPSRLIEGAAATAHEASA